MREVFSAIVGILNESSPYLLMGFALAGVIHVLLGRLPGLTARLAGTGRRPVLWAALIGAPMPLCSCSVLPAAMALRRGGASKGATASFLVSVPETDVVSVLVTLALLGPLMAVYRPIAVIALVHVILRGPFFEITNGPAGAQARGRRLFVWDLLFYTTFGFVVTSAVQMAGVLLVFGFLVIPAVAGVIASPRPGRALAVGWIFGSIGSVVGLVGSVTLDLPAAPSILVTLTLLLLVVGALLGWARRGRSAASGPG